MLVVRLIIGSLFVWMGWQKIKEPVTFLKLMRQYSIFDEQSGYFLMNFVAVVLPWVEVVCGLVLLSGVALRGAGLTAAAMLVVFTPMILMRGMELFNEGAASTFCGVKFDCGCGAGEVFVCRKLLENGALLFGAVVVLFARTRKFCLSNLLTRGTPAGQEIEPAPTRETA